MCSFLEIDLSHGVHAEPFSDIDQQSDLDAVARAERDLLEQAATAGVLSRERLDQAGQVRPEHVDQGSRRQLRNSPAFERPCSPARIPSEGATVEGLHVADIGIGEDRPERAEDETRMEVRDVGIEPQDDVAAKDEEALPQRFALARQRLNLREDVSVLVDVRTPRSCGLDGAIGGSGVDDDELVDEWHAIHQLDSDPLDDAPNCRFLVQSGNRDGHDEALLAFRSDKVGNVEVGVAVGAPGEPVVGAASHGRG